MQTVTLEEAQKHLTELVHNLSSQGELLIVEANRPVARLLIADQFSKQERTDLANRLQGGGLKYLKHGSDPIKDLTEERRSEAEKRQDSL